MDGFHVPEDLLSVLSPAHPIGGSLTVLEPSRRLGFVIDNDSRGGPVNVAVVPQARLALWGLLFQEWLFHLVIY